MPAKSGREIEEPWEAADDLASANACPAILLVTAEAIDAEAEGTPAPEAEEAAFDWEEEAPAPLCALAPAEVTAFGPIAIDWAIDTENPGPLKEAVAVFVLPWPDELKALEFAFAKEFLTKAVVKASASVLGVPTEFELAWEAALAFEPAIYNFRLVFELYNPIYVSTYWEIPLFPYYFFKGLISSFVVDPNSVLDPWRFPPKSTGKKIPTPAQIAIPTSKIAAWILKFIIKFL